MKKTGFFRAFLLVFSISITTPALADVYEDEYQPDAASAAIVMFKWPKWQYGYDLGLRAAGHFGEGTSLNAPRLGLMLNGGAHVWFEHLIELHANLSVGLSNSFFVYGFGTRVNMLEFIKDPTPRLYGGSSQRGFLSPFLKDLMIYISVEGMHYSFPTPPPGATYSEGGQWAVQPGLGVQWYFQIKSITWLRRWYVDMLASYTELNDNRYLVPLLGFGVELK